ncbi:MAG: hydrogenase iron-sulfur subunit [Promethearchaeota archaeon]|nr:MAG: hydrogenase iron-sulfur subunit [Candidatus Lokiarchaeota archaeon]
MSFEPKILGFLCNWCSYAGADLAGVSRIQYPPNIRVIRVMCSGRVDPEFIFDGFEAGIDGIIVMGCHPGDCHYLEGNYEAEKKFNMVEKLLSFVDMNERIRLEWVSASEGNRFAEIVTEFTDKIKELGPSPVKDPSKANVLLKNINALKMSAVSYRLRALVGRERALTEQENIYGEKVSLERFNDVFENAIFDEYVRNRIVLSLKEDTKSVKDLAIELNMDPSKILSHILILKGRSQVSMDKIVGITPLYISTLEE